MIYQPTLGMRIANQALNAVFACIILIAVFTFGPMIETAWFPVYSRFSIVSIDRENDHQSRVIFKFTKYRQCDPQGAAWYFGEPGGAFHTLRVNIQSQSASAPRPIGTQITSPYVIDATIEDLANATFAEVYNHCHPFWLTRSEIFP